MAITMEVALVLLVVFVRVVGIIYKHLIRKDVVEMVDNIILEGGSTYSLHS